MPNGLTHQKTGEHTYDLTVSSEEEIPLIVRGIVGAGGDLYHISAGQMSLEEIYFSLIDRSHGETEGGN